MGEAVLGDAARPLTGRTSIPSPPPPPIDLSPRAAAISASTAAPAALTLELARPWQLVAARLIDALGLGLMALAVAVLDVWVLGPGWRPQSVGPFAVLAEWFEVHAFSTKVAFGWAMLAGSIHFVITSSRHGRSLGAWLTGTRLVRTSNRPLGLRLALLRTLLSYISLLAGGAGFLWALVDRRRRSWHDLAVGTVLIREPRDLSDQATRVATPSSTRAG
jgi:uncharacterized RDD family membrane protein YckC